MNSSKNKTKIKIVLIIGIWLVGSITFLFQAKFERSLIFAEIFPSGINIDIKPIKIDPVNPIIDPNIDPNTVICDSINIDSINVIKKEKLPKSYSLKEYAPEVKSQGQLGSCVSWATAYAGLTIVKRIEQANKTAPSYSPLNLYIRIKKKKGEEPCSYGANIFYALNVLVKKGCSIFSKFKNDCSAYVETDKEYSDKLYSFSEITSSNIEKIKMSIANKMPVVIGISCYSGTSWQNAYLEDGLWNGFYSGEKNGGHAMCLIGYDDNKGDGAFLIMNSWGSDWGQDGFFWIRYKDFPIHVDECYALIEKKNK